jgi:hypothetical protein
MTDHCGRTPNIEYDHCVGDIIWTVLDAIASVLQSL